MADYIKCELIGGGSPRHLKHFFQLFYIVAVYYILINTRYVLLLLLSGSMDSMLSTKK